MRLMIGGVGQGKLDYALRETGFTQSEVSNTINDAQTAKIWNHFAQNLRELDAEGVDCAAAVEEILRANPDIIILCDEVGCGVVPLVPEERRWRETVGRICCSLAARATRVERVFCGIPMQLKGD